MTGGAAGVTVKVDVAAGAAYVSLPGAADAEVFRTLELRDDVLVDVDEHGTLIGIEILSLNLTDPIPPVVPAGQEVLSDLAARLAAADIDWARALGDPPAEPEYILWLARRAEIFEPAPAGQEEYRSDLISALHRAAVVDGPALDGVASGGERQ